MNKCSECNIKFKSGAKKIGCGFCGKWFHAEGCTVINPQLYDMLSKEKQLHWYCKSCNEIDPEVLGTVQKCLKDNIETKKNLADMKKELQDLKQDGSLKEAVEKIVREVLEEYKDEMVAPERQNTDSIRDIAREVFEENQAETVETETPSLESIRNIARGEVRENNDKKGREANIVISNVDESKEAEAEVTEMLAHLGVTVEVNGIRRMGREKKPNYNRLIWVRLGSKQERNNVLDAAKKLKDEDRWKNTYINKDMTEEERKQAYKIRQELKKKRRQENVQNGRSRFIIHRGRVVNRENGLDSQDETQPATERRTDDNQEEIEEQED